MRLDQQLRQNFRFFLLLLVIPNLYGLLGLWFGVLDRDSGTIIQKLLVTSLVAMVFIAFHQFFMARRRRYLEGFLNRERFLPWTRFHRRFFQFSVGVCVVLFLLTVGAILLQGGVSIYTEANSLNQARDDIYKGLLGGAWLNRFSLFFRPLTLMIFPFIAFYWRHLSWRDRAVGGIAASLWGLTALLFLGRANIGYSLVLAFLAFTAANLPRSTYVRHCLYAIGGGGAVLLALFVFGAVRQLSAEGTMGPQSYFLRDQYVLALSEPYQPLAEGLLEGPFGVGLLQANHYIMHPWYNLAELMSRDLDFAQPFAKSFFFVTQPFEKLGLLQPREYRLFLRDEFLAREGLAFTQWYSAIGDFALEFSFFAVVPLLLLISYASAAFLARANQSTVWMALFCATALLLPLLWQITPYDQPNIQWLFFLAPFFVRYLAPRV